MIKRNPLLNSYLLWLYKLNNIMLLHVIYHLFSVIIKGRNMLNKEKNYVPKSIWVWKECRSVAWVKCTSVKNLLYVFHCHVWKKFNIRTFAVWITYYALEYAKLVICEIYILASSRSKLWPMKNKLENMKNREVCLE